MVKTGKNSETQTSTYCTALKPHPWRYWADWELLRNANTAFKCSLLWLLWTQFPEAHVETRFSSVTPCTITLCAVHTWGKEQSTRIKLEWHGFPADGLCYKPALLPRFLMYAKLLEWHWFQVTPGCVLIKCYYLLKAAVLQDPAMHQLRCSVIATEPPCENPCSTEPLNKGNHDQDAENESTHSWTPEIPKMIQLSQALWEARSRAHTALSTGTVPLNILLLFLLLSCLGHRHLGFHQTLSPH